MVITRQFNAYHLWSPYLEWYDSLFKRVWHSNYPDSGHLVSGLILFQWHVKTDNFVNTPFPAGVMGYPGLNEYSSSWQTRVMDY